VRRRRFSIPSTLSLLLCVAVVVLWVRSLWVIDYIQWTDHRHFPAVVSSDGRIIYSYQFWPNGVGGNQSGLGIGSRPGDPPYWSRSYAKSSRNYFAGFEWSPAAGVQPNKKLIGIYIPTPTTYLVAVASLVPLPVGIHSSSHVDSQLAAIPLARRRPLPLLRL
jgi:hypothetical protein